MVTRQAVVVGRTARVTNLARRVLQPLGVDIAEAPDRDKALYALRSAQNLALVLVHLADEEIDDIVTAARERDPHVPILWVKSHDDAWGTIVTQDAGQGTKPGDGDLAQGLLDALTAFLFPPEVTRHLARVVQEVFWESLSTRVRPGVPYLTASKTGLAGTGAIASFSAARWSGALCVEADREYFSTLCERLLPGAQPTATTVKDLAREATYQVVGRFSTFLLRHNIELKRGFAISFFQSETSALYRPGRIAWVLPLHDGDDTVYLACCLDRFNAADLDSAPIDVDVLDPGTVTFFGDAKR